MASDLRDVGILFFFSLLSERVIKVTILNVFIPKEKRGGKISLHPESKCAALQQGVEDPGAAANIP